MGIVQNSCLLVFLLLVHRGMHYRNCFIKTYITISYVIVFNRLKFYFEVLFNFFKFYEKILIKERLRMQELRAMTSGSQWKIH